MPMRALIRDPRVAAVAGVSAVLLVAYRFQQGMAGPASAALAAEPAAAPGAAAGARLGAGGPEADARPAVGCTRLSPGGAPGAAEPAWSWERNPFLPPRKDDASGPLRSGLDGGAGGRAGGLDLEAALRGTVVSGGHGVAIFGDRVVSEGERVGAWRVEKVEPYRVIVRRGAESRTLEMLRAPPPAP